MAEGGLEESGTPFGGVEESWTPFQQATAEMCNVCLMDDSFKHGQWFCQQCRQRLCDKCHKYHRNVSSTKSHEIIRTDEMPATSPQLQEADEGVSDEVQDPVCQTHDEPIEFYCQKHKTGACGTCKLMDHRKCQLQDLEHAVVGTRCRNQEVLQELREARAHMKKIEDAMGKEMEELEAHKAVAIEKIQRKIEEVEVLGQKKIAEVEEKFQQERNVLDREACMIKKSSALVEKSIKELERATNAGSEEQIFLATRKAENDASKFHDIVRESSNVSHTEIFFEVDDRLRDIASIGNVCVDKSTTQVDITPEVIQFLNTEHSVSQIKWFHVLPSERIILLVYDMSLTSQLRLYSPNKNLLSKLDLPLAMSADMLDDHQVIVALPDKQQLQIVNMDNDNLTKGPVINIRGAPWLILKDSDSSVLGLTRHYHDVKFRFQILDLNRVDEKQINIRADLNFPTYMRMRGDRTAVFVVDQQEGCLSLNLSGNEIFHYTHQEYDFYDGLALDPHGNLYISVGLSEDCIHVSRSVIKLSPAGQALKQLDMKRSYPLHCIKSKLYVGTRNDQNKLIISCFYI